MQMYKFGDQEPQVASDAFVATTATLIGDVRVEGGATVCSGAVLRGDYNQIIVGIGSTIQDNCVIHTSKEQPTTIGSNVIIGHSSILEACEIEDGVFLGKASIVSHRSRVGRGAALAAGSVVPEDRQIPSEVLAAGTPAEVKESIMESTAQQMTFADSEYEDLRIGYIREFMERIPKDEDC